MKLKQIFASFFFLASGSLAAQADSLLIAASRPNVAQEIQDFRPYNPLAPAKAAFYSAVLPGLGQAYNGKYWKIPLVYAGLGIGTYFYLENDDQFWRFRSAFKRRLEGFTDDEFIAPDGTVLVTNDGLIRAQRFFRRNKEISVLVIIGFYALNIIDANVDAHLQQFNVSEDLSLKPAMDFNRHTGKTGYGLSLNYNF